MVEIRSKTDLPKVCLTRRNLIYIHRIILKSFVELDGFDKALFDIKLEMFCNNTVYFFNNIRELILFYKQNPNVEITKLSYSFYDKKFHENHTVYIRFSSDSTNAVFVISRHKAWTQKIFDHIHICFMKNKKFDFIKFFRYVSVLSAICTVLFMTLPIIPIELLFGIFAVSSVCSFWPKDLFPHPYFRRNQFLID